MGYPGKNRKKYEKPIRKFEKARIEEETALVIEYGLRNKRELWRAQHKLRGYRRMARNLLALISTQASPDLVERRRGELLDHLYRIGLVKEDADIDDVLALRVEKELERRLQTIVYRKGLARSPKQARQFITHGHIAIGERRVSIPSYRVSREEEAMVRYYPQSPLNQEMHPEKMRIVKGGR